MTALSISWIQTTSKGITNSENSRASSVRPTQMNDSRTESCLFFLFFQTLPMEKTCRSSGTVNLPSVVGVSQSMMSANLMPTTK